MGEFAVSRERIRARPREYYERLLELVYSPTPSTGCSGPQGHFCCREWCHDLEHLWHIIFGEPQMLPQHICPRVSNSVSQSIVQGLGGRSELEYLLGHSRMSSLSLPMQ